MISVDEFAPAIRQQATSAPDPIVKRAIVDAAIDFCRRTFAWQAAGFPQDIRAGTKEYFIPAPQGGRIIALLAASVSASRLSIEAQADIPLDAATGSPQYAALTDENRLTVYPTPTENALSALVVRVAFSPKPDVDSLPDLLFDRYRYAVEQGALIILKSIPNSSWSAPADIAYHERELRRECAKAKGDVLTGHLQVKGRRFC